MKVGWLVDDPGYIGGAELTQDEFRRSAPDGVEVVSCPAAEVVPDLDRYVFHNVVNYTPADLEPTGGAPRFKYLHDVWPYGDPELKEALLSSATLICCSPLQRQTMGLDAALIPPPVDLSAFRPPRQQRRNSKRKGACAIGAFRHPNKGGQQLNEWARENGDLDVYGVGRFVPTAGVNYRGSLEPTQVAQTLWQYERFVHLPAVIEPFGRCVVEAWAAGCEVITNGNVGARWWIEQEPEKLETAAGDFWEIVCG